ncbi:MAG: uroporphyrinogen decarboxylase family protein [Lachnospiraceae bacterium]|nr:uroporphyrinogen decarboxylase family protein [Lachnospiraceae bacterium]
MNGYERTVAFVKGEPVDHPPFMPLVIEWASVQCGLDYRDFIYKPEVRTKAYLDIVERFDLDHILVDADFSEQLEDFGQIPVWKESTGYVVEPIINSPEDIDKLVIPEIKPGTRQGNRIEIIKGVAAKEKGHRYIFGICVGPFTEYCNARGLKKVMKEMVKDPDTIRKGMKVFFENGMNFIKAQMEAGADGIQIVEPNCSLISPKFYEENILPLHKEMVAEIQKHENGFARVHVCGDTSALMPYTLATGTHILDVDSAVDLEKVAHLLGPEQVFCGNLNTAEELLMGTPDIFPEAVQKRVDATNNRIILCSGCDVPPATPAENMHAFHDAVVNCRQK